MEHNRAAATTCIFQPEAASAPGISSEAREGDADIPLAVAPVVPGSRSVTLCYHFEFTKVQFSWIKSSLKIGPYSRLGGCIAVQVDRGKERSAKQCGVIDIGNIFLKILSISSELSFLPMPPPLY